MDLPQILEAQEALADRAVAAQGGTQARLELPEPPIPAEAVVVEATTEQLLRRAQLAALALLFCPYQLQIIPA